MVASPRANAGGRATREDWIRRGREHGRPDVPQHDQELRARGPRLRPRRGGRRALRGGRGNRRRFHRGGGGRVRCGVHVAADAEGRRGGGPRRGGHRGERPPGHGPHRPQHQCADHGAQHRRRARAEGHQDARRAGQRRHERSGEGDHRHHGGRRPGGLRRVPAALRVVRQERHLRRRPRGRQHCQDRQQHGGVLQHGERSGRAHAGCGGGGSTRTC